MMKRFVQGLLTLALLIPAQMAAAQGANGLPPADPNLFNTNQGYNFATMRTQIESLATWFFGVGTIYFVFMVWRNGLNLAKAGDNPSARAQASSALWANALGGLVFFGAAVFTSIIRSFATQ